MTKPGFQGSLIITARVIDHWFALLKKYSEIKLQEVINLAMPPQTNAFLPFNFLMPFVKLDFQWSLGAYNYLAD